MDASDTPKEGAYGFGVSCLTLLAVLVAADVTFRDSKFSRAVDDGSWIPVKRKLMAESAADIVVVGSSVIGEGLNPSEVTSRIKEKTGKTLRVFNFGVSAGSFAAYYLIADSVLEIPRETRPQYFIVSLSPMEFSCCPPVEVPSMEKWAMAIRLKDIPPLLRAAPTFEEAANDVMLGGFRLLAVRPNVLSSIYEFHGPPSPASWPADGGGGAIGAVDPGTQNQRATHRAEAYRPTMMKPPHTLDRVTPDSYLSTMVARLARGGVRTAFIGAQQAPQMNAIDGPDSIYPDYEEHVTELGRKLGTGFRNYRVMEGVTAADFADGDHLTSAGSIKFSRKLADEVIVPMMSGELRPTQP